MTAEAPSKQRRGGTNNAASTNRSSNSTTFTIDERWVDMRLTLPRIVLAGVSSGVGKTTMTTAFIAHVRTRGIAVQSFKVGPDYIDPSHLALAASRPCYNLDTWMMPPRRMLDVFCTAAASAEIAVIEGVMGLYDGQSSTSDVGSTAEVAKILQAPVVLVIDASAMARSAAAVVLGFQHLDPYVHIVGVIANRVGGAGHARLLQEAIEAETSIAFLGYFRDAPDKLLPERHLGLVPAAERLVSAQQLTALGQQFGQTCDGERLLALAREAPPLEQSSQELFSSMETTQEHVNIAIAHPVRLLLLSKDASCIIIFKKRQIERNHTLWQPSRQRAKTNTLLTLKMPRK